jgi:GGDEF domain-containing protein
VVRALADDSEIGRISRGGALELPMPRTLPGAGAATTGEGAVQAVDALQAVVWSAVREELRRPDAEQVALLAERLSLVFERLRAAAVHAVGPPPGEPIVAELWRRTLEEEVMRAERTGAALAVLLVELEDADRILAVDAPSEASATLARFPQAVRSAVRTGDVVARESDGRVWVAARETGAVQARGLAARISDAVRGAEPWRGAPLRATVGVAALGEHGRSAEELILSAEEARFAAAAAGLPSND